VGQTPFAGFPQDLFRESQVLRHSVEQAMSMHLNEFAISNQKQPPRKIQTGGLQ